ncbi:MAG: hypothetical protein ACYTFM_03430 [Planctomycetota bacterium]
MKRREFLASSCLAAVSLSQLAKAADEPTGSRQYLELRHYEIASAEHRKVFDDFLAKAAIPALNHLGVSPVGVFKSVENENYDLWVLAPHNNLESAVTANCSPIHSIKRMAVRFLILRSTIRFTNVLKAHCCWHSISVLKLKFRQTKRAGYSSYESMKAIILSRPSVR